MIATFNKDKKTGFYDGRRIVTAPHIDGVTCKGCVLAHSGRSGTCDHSNFKVCTNGDYTGMGWRYEDEVESPDPVTREEFDEMKDKCDYNFEMIKGILKKLHVVAEINTSTIDLQSDAIEEIEKILATMDSKTEKKPTLKVPCRCPKCGALPIIRVYNCDDQIEFGVRCEDLNCPYLAFNSEMTVEKAIDFWNKQVTGG